MTFINSYKANCIKRMNMSFLIFFLSFRCFIGQLKVFLQRIIGNITGILWDMSKHSGDLTIDPSTIPGLLLSVSQRM